MQPSERRLLGSINDALLTLAPSLDETQQGIIGCVQMALTELLLRYDGAFIGQQLSRAGALIHQGRTLMTAAGETPPGAATADSLDAAMQALAALTAALNPAADRDSRIGDYLAAVVDWENALYQRRQQLPQPHRTDDAPVVTEAALLAYMRERFPARSLARVANITALKGGFSKITVLFDLVDADGATESLVIRAEQALRLLFLPGAKVRNEFNLLRLAFDAGIPVAEPLWLETRTELMGGAFIVSRRASGSNIGSRIDISAAVTDTLLRDFIRKLVDIHRLRIDPDSPLVRDSHLREPSRLETRQQAVDYLVNLWRDGIAGLKLPPSPIIERALGWLAANVPDDERAPVVLHGDYGLHNILVDGERVSCILDWESSGMGHPAEDLAWLLDGLGAQIERQRIIDIYEEESGETLSPFALYYFEVMNALKFAVTCPTALALFDRHEATGIDALKLGLFFTHFGTGKLNPAIANAAKVR